MGSCNHIWRADGICIMCDAKAVAAPAKKPWLTRPPWFSGYCVAAPLLLLMGVTSPHLSVTIVDCVMAGYSISRIVWIPLENKK